MSSSLTSPGTHPVAWINRAITKSVLRYVHKAESLIRFLLTFFLVFNALILNLNYCF
jgi:hypothetical protein